MPDQPALHDLMESLRRGDSDASLIDLAIAAARQHLDMDLSLLSEFHDGQQVYRHLSGEHASFGCHRDGGRPLEETYCQRLVDGAIPAVIPDTSHNPQVRDLDVTHDAGIGAYVGVPVRLPGGRLYGTLCCLSHDPDPMLRKRDARFLEVLAAVVAEEVGREQAEAARRREMTDRITAVMREEALTIAFQPIVALADRRLVGLEALARVRWKPEHRTPEGWFSEAWEVGLGVDLELVAVREALAQLDRVPADAYVSINVSPATAAAPEFEAELRRSDPNRLLVEVTEHQVAREYEVLVGAMRRIRALGVRFAVDDMGAGYAGLNHVVRLAPDVIKLDRFLSTGIHNDPARQALASAAAAFAEHSGTRVIAEGIEDAAEHERLLALGIRYGQGYYYGRPASLEEICAAA
jgi:EAL domain-containing protein (putative c-di-GMP-specific phosphodiesterase class I)